MMFVKQKLESSSSFRALVINFAISKFYFGISGRVPTHSTIINWVHKIGYYHLTQRKIIANDWIIILDHSIQLGQDKLIVIFGIRESDIDFTRPIQYQDLVPFRVESRKKWNGDSICKYLIDLKKEIGGIKYAVGDYGSDIKKGLKDAKIKHIHDLTHAIALILEKVYAEDGDYLEFTTQMSEMRIKLSQTDRAHIIPPKQRKKSRYQNIKTISDWGVNAIRLLDNSKNLDENIRQALAWVKPFRPFIKELSEINKTICDVEKILKSQGLSAGSIKQCNYLLLSLSNAKGIVVKEKLTKYFEEMKNLIDGSKKILCTSDIIESAFGKYKNYLSNNPMAGVTNLALCIAAFTSSLKEDVVRDALETTTTNSIKDWTKDFIGKTLLQKRREAFA